METTVAANLDLKMRQQLSAQCTGSDARGRFAGAGTFQHVADGCTEFQKSGEVRVARGGGQSSSGAVSIRLSLFQTAMTIGAPILRLWRTPLSNSAWSVSIFMRPPRPYPFWRRANCLLISSIASGTPNGKPSMSTKQPAPCDSPAERNVRLPKVTSPYVHNPKLYFSKE